MLAGLLGLRFWAGQLSELAFVPSARFVAPKPLAADAYDRPAMWLARPGKAGDPTRWLPAGAAPARPLPALVFYVHPTTLFDKASWNARLPDPATDARTALFAGSQASAFNGAALAGGGGLWAPYYRQATYGAFLTRKADGAAALDAAYRDVLLAFDHFLVEARAHPGLPIVLVGHSQGALHLMHLLRDRVAGTPLAGRIAAAYVVGWPVSVTHDLPAMGLPACARADQPGCVLSWMSFAEPADPSATLEAYARLPGLDGQKRGGTPILCTNPLTGTPNAAAPASANLGTLAPDPAGARLVPGMVPARCGENGFLLIGSGPQMGDQVLPGGDYHVYDIALFWANLRADVARRVAAWKR